MRKGRVEEVLYYYDGPLMVWGTSDSNYWFSTVIDEDDEGYQWLAVFINQETLNGLLANTVSIRDTLTRFKIGPYYQGRFDGFKGDQVILNLADQEPSPDIFPADGVCLRY